MLIRALQNNRSLSTSGAKELDKREKRGTFSHVTTLLLHLRKKPQSKEKYIKPVF